MLIWGLTLKKKIRRPGASLVPCDGWLGLSHSSLDLGNSALRVQAVTDSKACKVAYLNGHRPLTVMQLIKEGLCLVARPRMVEVCGRHVGIRG
jgi:hypothetical protein